MPRAERHLFRQMQQQQTVQANTGPPRLGGPTAEGVEFFETHIRPVLAEKCYQCHSARRKRSKAACGWIRPSGCGRRRIGSYRRAKQAQQKPAPISPCASRIERDATQRQTAGCGDQRLREMGRDGAPDRAPGAVAADEPREVKADPRDHWAYQTTATKSTAKVAHESVGRSDIDRFVLARLEAAGFTPSPQAPPRAFFPLRRSITTSSVCRRRRRSRCVRGRSQRSALSEAQSTGCSASPRYRRAWGRHWLDVARYADTKGYVVPAKDRKLQRRLHLSRLGNRQSFNGTCPTISSSSIRLRPTSWAMPTPAPAAWVS